MVNKILNKVARAKIVRRRHNRKVAPKSNAVKLAHRRLRKVPRVSGKGKRVAGTVSGTVRLARRRILVKAARATVRKVASARKHVTKN